jgi:hypothetical protein
MKYEGNLQDLVSFSAERITSDYFVIKFQNQPYDFSGKGKFVYRSVGYATAALNNHMFVNLLQGHYWHKGKNNTFEKEKGQMRNGGLIAGLSQEFKKMAKELVKQLLADKIFTIEKINL